MHTFIVIISAWHVRLRQYYVPPEGSNLTHPAIPSLVGVISVSVFEKKMEVQD